MQYALEFEMMTWLDFYGGVLLFMRGCARNKGYTVGLRDDIF